LLNNENCDFQAQDQNKDVGDRLRRRFL